MSDHVHTQACVVACRRYPGTTGATAAPAPATKPWDQRECPHGYGFDCCTQCHEAFHAGRESMTPTTKMSFEYRVEMFPRPYTGPTDAKVTLGDITEAVAKLQADCDPAPCSECGKAPCESFIQCSMGAMKRRVAADIAKHAPRPDGVRTKVPPLKPFQRVQSFKIEDLAPKTKTCTCGAASVGSRLHSEWCECA